MIVWIFTIQLEKQFTEEWSTQRLLLWDVFISKASPGKIPTTFHREKKKEMVQDPYPQHVFHWCICGNHWQFSRQAQIRYLGDLGEWHRRRRIRLQENQSTDNKGVNRTSKWYTTEDKSPDSSPLEGFFKINMHMHYCNHLCLWHLLKRSNWV